MLEYKYEIKSEKSNITKNTILSERDKAYCLKSVQRVMAIPGTVSAAIFGTFPFF